MRLRLLAASTLVVGTMSGPGPASADDYPYCSSEGSGVGQSCTYETKAQCDASVGIMGVFCFANPRYKPPVVVAPTPPPVAPPTPQKRRATTPPGTKS